MRKNLLVTALFGVSISLGVAWPALAAGTDKTTGDAADAVRAFQVSAHGPVGDRPAKGEATLTNTNGNYWTMSVADYKERNSETGCFIGPITESNVVDTPRWMRVVVVDAGPGAADRVYTRQASATEAASWFANCNQGSLGLQLTADSGNLTVH